jgi:hypothetical protein
MSHQNHPFILGEKYADRRGQYTVLAVEGDRLRIRYDSDEVETYGDIVIKARIFKNILSEQRNLHPIQTDRYFFFLGFLAKHGEFQAEVPPQSQANFEEHYKLLVGETPLIHRDGYFPIEIETTWDKWGPELRIYFPEIDDNRIDLPGSVDPRPASAPETLRINNNGFWWKLVALGFRLGRCHDVGKIRASIPAKFHANYEEGLHH